MTKHERAVLYGRIDALETAVAQIKCALIDRTVPSVFVPTTYTTPSVKVESAPPGSFSVPQVTHYVPAVKPKRKRKRGEKRIGRQ